MKSASPQSQTGRAATGLAFRTGARIPGLQVRDADGRPTDLPTLLEGRPALVVYVPRPHSPAARQAARRLARLETGVAGLQRILLLPASTGGADAAALAADGVVICVARDEYATEDERLLPWAATDKAARVTHAGSVRPAELGRLGPRLRAAAASADKTSAGGRGIVSQAAPVLMVPDVLGRGLCRRLIEHFDRKGGHPSGVLDLSGPEPQWRPDAAVKQRLDLTLEEPELIRELEAATAARVLPEIRKCHHYTVTHHEPFKLVSYDEGSGYFRPHRDNETHDTLYRRFAMTINLNTGDYDGGGLQFPEFGSTVYRPPLGGAIIFSCSLLHEATDVTRGRRYAVLGFFYNPDDGLER